MVILERGISPSGLMTHADMRFQVRELRKDILSALAKQQFIFIDPDKVADIRRSIKDWEGIMSAFGFIKQDVDDHHDCFAVGKNNASVFHLMRVVEWGLRALCIHVGFRSIKSKSKATGRSVDYAYRIYRVGNNARPDPDAC